MVGQAILYYQKWVSLYYAIAWRHTLGSDENDNTASCLMLYAIDASCRSLA